MDEVTSADHVVAAQLLIGHEQACDSCWCQEDALQHLCGDEDPVSHRDSAEEVTV